jgi:hypothetical protein
MHIKPTDLTTDHLIGLPANTDHFTRARLGVYVWRATTYRAYVGAVVAAENEDQAWAKLRIIDCNYKVFSECRPTRYEFDEYFPTQVFGL